ncbi:hypothetical protein HKI87_02g15390 [Chloropicon roscoffensis]|uniref:Uncharacterized protein n=2 Tax=Chloropicon roscoffensis TaxID=1461544 RepID=A0AAX4P1U8_9CHLO
MEEESIYSLAQLLEAFQSSLDGLDEQLQLLRILDADSAPSWPGMSQAVFALKQSSAQVAEKCREQSTVIKALDKDVDSFKHESAVLSDQLQGSEKEVRVLTSKVRFLEKEVEKHEIRHSEDDREKSDLRSQLAELERNHLDNLEYKRSLEETLNGKEKELGECQRMIEEQGDAHDEMAKKLELLRAKGDEMTISLKQSEAALDARVHDLQQTRVQCEELVRSKAQLSEELRQKKLALEDSQQKLNGTESELERMKQWHVWLKQAEQERISEQRDKHQKQVEELVTKINDMKVVHERALSKHTTERASREVVESQMHKLEQDAWVRASELKSLHKEHETLVDDNKRLMQQTETLRVAKDRLIEEKTSVMMRLAEVESELKKTGTEGKLEVESVISRHRAEVSELEKESKVLQAEKDSLTRELHRLQDEHDVAHQSLAQCRRDLSQTKDQLERVTHEKVKLEGELKSTRQTLDRTLQRMQRESAAGAAEINRLKNVQESILDSQLAQDRQRRLQDRRSRITEEEPAAVDVRPVHPNHPDFDAAAEAERHLAALREKEKGEDKESVENHALNRVKLLLQSIENDHRSYSPVR